MDLPYFPWWYKDYNGDPLVQAMSDDQDLAYRRMIEASWDLGALPPEPEKLARLIRFSPEKFESVWTFPLIECWHQNGNGFLINSRTEIEKKRAKKNYKTRIDNGRKGGRPPKTKKAKEKSRNRTETGRFPEKTGRLSTETGRIHNQNQNQNHKKKIPPGGRKKRPPPENPYPFLLWWDRKAQRLKTDEPGEDIVAHFLAFAEENGTPTGGIRELLRKSRLSFERHARQEKYTEVSPQRLTVMFVKWAERDILDSPSSQRKAPAEQWVEAERATYDAYSEAYEEWAKGEPD